MVAAVEGDADALQTTIFFGDPAWEALTSAAVDADALRAADAALDPDDPINIQYTSGTTGAPKGATLSHHNILNNGFFVGEEFPLTVTGKVRKNVMRERSVDLLGLGAGNGGG